MDTLLKGIHSTSTDTGAVAATLSSTTEEPKTLESITITDVSSNPVVVTVYIEREKIVDSIYLPVAAVISPARVITLNRPIPAGQAVSVQVESYTAGAHGVLIGWVNYSIGTA